MPSGILCRWARSDALPLRDTPDLKEEFASNDNVLMLIAWWFWLVV